MVNLGDIDKLFWGAVDDFLDGYYVGGWGGRGLNFKLRYWGFIL